MRALRTRGARAFLPSGLLTVLALLRELLHLALQLLGIRAVLTAGGVYPRGATGDLVIYLTRYGERSEKDWMLADYYRYRVAMP